MSDGKFKSLKRAKYPIGNQIRKVTVYGLLLLSISCLEPYQPPEIAQNIKILVVDGFVNSTAGSANVKLSHTNPISSESSGEPETNATVTIEDENGASFSLTEQPSGYYTAEGMDININSKYRLVIQRSDNQRVSSDFIALKNAPPIDSISWAPENDGLNIFVNTHDASGEARYYYWDYVETWEYVSPQFSYYKWVNKVPTLREPNESTYKCWRTVPSSKITVGSSLHLEENVIKGFPITFIPAGSTKISILYSILVRQRTLRKEEYDFWKELQKTTENLGGLFDPLPYQVKGNLRSDSDPNTEVLGIFSGGSVQETRFFINAADVPAYLRNFPRPYCPIDTVCIKKNPLGDTRCRLGLSDLNGSELLLDALAQANVVWGYTIGTPDCADCRTHGGVLTRPDFWK